MSTRRKTENVPDKEKSRVLTIWGKFYGTGPIVDKKFIHKGIMVREMIGELADELGTYKLLWCRIPMDLIIDGWKNPFFHVDFSPKSDVMYSFYPAIRRMEEAARTKVMQAFDEYWKL